MHRYDIITGILLILSMIDFALAAPISVQDSGQALVDVVHIPKDVITVFGERSGDEELEKLGEEYFKTEGKPVESSGTYLSSSSAESEHDDGSTNVEESPAPNTASSISNSDSLVDPSSCLSSTSSMHGLSARGSCLTKVAAYLDRADYQQLVNEYNDVHGFGLLQPMSTLKSPVYRPHDPLSPPLSWLPERPQPRPKPSPLADPDFDWEGWMNAPDPSSSGQRHPSLPSSFGGAHWYKVDPKDQPSSSGHGPSPPIGEPENEVVTSPSSPNLGSESPKEPEYEMAQEPLPTPESTDPMLHLDPQSSSSDSQPVDLQSIVYAAKGKAKQLRRISSSTRDVGDVAQRKLQPAEMSLGPGE
jgi:hypothetical protein